MKSFLKFIGGWFLMLFFFALVSLVINWKTTDYADCLNNEIVWWWTLGVGWIAGGVWSFEDLKDF